MRRIEHTLLFFYVLYDMGDLCISTVGQKHFTAREMEEKSPIILETYNYLSINIFL